MGDDLLALALSRPSEALSRATELVEGSSDLVQLSYAHQAAGIVVRDRGDVRAAIDHLRAALRLAEKGARPDRAADIRATLGAALVMAGRTRPGLAELDAAAAAAEGSVLPRVLMRRAYVFTLLGRHAEALDALRRALPGIRRSGDLVWQARALNNRADIHIALGAITRAEQDLEAAQGLFREAGQELEEVHALHNRGLLEFRRGDLPATLALLDEAAHRYARLDVDPPELAIDRCAALIAAGLGDDARRVVRSALEHGCQPTQRAELQLVLAQASLANDEPGDALRSAREALRTFRGQRRPWWELQAELVALRALEAVSPGRARLDTAASVGWRLTEAGSDEAPLGLILAGRIAARQGRLDECHELLAVAARYRRRDAALHRVTGWLAQALSCEITGNQRGAMVACSRGMEALDEHQTSLGSSELRALATAHGRELASIALRAASRRGARPLLAWSERWRATALALPPVRPPREAELAADLTALRDTERRLESARRSGEQTSSLERERDRLERSVRSRSLHAPGGPDRPHRFETGHLLDALGDTTLLELVAVDGVIQALVVADGRVRRFRVGTAEEAGRAVELARFSLRQAARGRRTDLGAVGPRLQQSLLGPAASALASLPAGPVVVCPPGSLSATPWALLPALTDRPVSVTPSAATWLRARRPEPAGAAGSRRFVVVGGPGLPASGREIVDLTSRRPDAVVLSDGTATVERTLNAISGAGLVHIVAHGRFRRDNPMFSCLVLDDGPLTVHDLERLAAPPRRLVLSACESGVLAPVGTEELIGLTSALLALGATGVVSSLVEVNDEATRVFMGELHAALRDTDTVARAVLTARRAVGTDPVTAATAASFVAFGA